MLTNLSPSEPAQTPILGYRGFIIQNLEANPDIPDNITVYKHVLTITQGTNISSKNDDNNIEDWLLNQVSELVSVK